MVVHGCSCTEVVLLVILCTEVALYRSAWPVYRRGLVPKWSCTDMALPRGVHAMTIGNKDTCAAGV